MCFLLRKTFSAILCPSYNVKMPASYDKTAATAESMLISLAAARLAVTSCILSLSSSVVFKGSLQQLILLYCPSLFSVLSTPGCIRARSRPAPYAKCPEITTNKVHLI